jgi:Polyketide cyclase / dehydrase and lipid transport
MPSMPQIFEHKIQINASLETVDRTITDRRLMHQWLNPALRCDPVGEWSTDVGAKSRFIIQVPLLYPVLESTVIERHLGLVVWSFDGFFKGTDRWECQPAQDQVCLTNRFEFQIPNPTIAFGFNTFAARWTRKDMQAQLIRLKQVAESIE